MLRWFKWCWWIVLIGLVECAPAAAPGPTVAPATQPLTSPLASPLSMNEASIRFQRTGGFAGSNDAWIIYPDGRIVHSGDTSSTSQQLTPDQVDQLNAAIRAANFMSLDDSYVPKNTCCDRFEYTITVTANGQSKTVRTIDAVPGEPPGLTALITVLSALVK